MSSYGAGGGNQDTARIARSKALLAKHRTERAKRSSSSAAPSPMVSFTPERTPSALAPEPQAMYAPSVGGPPATGSYAYQSPVPAQRTASGYLGYGAEQLAPAPHSYASQAALDASAGASYGWPQQPAQTVVPPPQWQQQPPQHQQYQPPPPQQQQQQQQYQAPRPEASPARNAPLSTTVAEERAHLQQLLGRLGGPPPQEAPPTHRPVTPPPAPAPAPAPLPQQQEYDPYGDDMGGSVVSSPRAQEFGKLVADSMYPVAAAVHSHVPLDRNNLQALYDAEVQGQLQDIGGDEDA